MSENLQVEQPSEYQQAAPQVAGAPTHFVVLHGMVGPWVKGDVVTERRLRVEWENSATRAVDRRDKDTPAEQEARFMEEHPYYTFKSRLLSLKAIRPANEFESGQSKVTVLDRAIPATAEQTLLEKDRELRGRDSRISRLEEELRHLRQEGQRLTTLPPAADPRELIEVRQSNQSLADRNELLEAKLREMQEAMHQMQTAQGHETGEADGRNKRRRGGD